MKLSPLKDVEKRFGSRAKLVEQILPLLETKEEGVKSELMGASNKKLLRIHETALEVKQKFGSRKALIEKITAARYPNGKPDDGFERRVQTATLKRLLEMHRKHS